MSQLDGKFIHCLLLNDHFVSSSTPKNIFGPGNSLPGVKTGLYCREHTHRLTTDAVTVPLYETAVGNALFYP